MDGKIFRTILAWLLAGFLSFVSIVEKTYALEFGGVVGNFSFYGGQYFFQGVPGALSGKMDVDFSPTVKISRKTAAILTLSTSYRGSKEVSELAGGGTLFQDAASMGGIFKIVSAELTPKLKIRPSVSYQRELLRETIDETWTKGLFDYDKISYGLETEYEFSKSHSLALGGDYFEIKFPNYVSLESQQKANDLGREQQGARTLDSNNFLAGIRSSHSFFNDRKLKIWLDFSQIVKNYPDQPVAISLDSLSATEKRKDTLLFGSLKGAYPLINPAPSLVGVIFQCGYSWISLDSTQNRVDATRAVFLKDYYDYIQSVPSVGFNFVIGPKPTTVSLLGSISSKNYSSRLVQDVSGAYGNDKIYINEQTISFKINYPIAQKLNAVLSSAYLKSESNMKYESVYRYNYDTAAYFAGVVMEF